MSVDRDLSLEARDPRTSADRLGELVDQEPALWKDIFLNPSCPEDLRSYVLSRLGEADQRRWKAELAERTRPRNPPRPAAPDPAPTMTAPTVAVPRGSVLREPPRRPAAGAQRRPSRTGPTVFKAVAVMFAVLLLWRCAAAVMKDDTGHRSRSASSVSASPTPVKVSPAPAGAGSATLIEAPSHNISCRLSGSDVTCSIHERYYAESGQQDCSDEYFSISVYKSTELACGQPISSSGTVLEYGESTANDDFACTSATDGMTCWNQYTGSGFKIARAGYSTW